MEVIYTRNSRDIAKLVAKELAISALPANVRSFGDGEICVSLGKAPREVVVIASTPNNDAWIELFLLLDALKNAKKVILCMTYLGYSRQDKQLENESFGARLFAQLLETMNLSNCIVIDNHTEPLLRIPTFHLSARQIFEMDIARKYSADQIVAVSPDIGGARRVDAFSRSLKCDFAICNKAKNVFGELKKVDKLGEVSNKICVIIDDMVDSGATLCYAAELLLKSGCKGVVAYCTHGVLANGSVERLEKSSLTEIVLTDSLIHPQPFPAKFRRLSISSLIAEAIRCIM
ncbi:MAG: ribose-phosphate diphosphokinase [Holosporaceae bacterium]|nr:ribose-phosphate diphosphokinase [Holosporaceae bacterium]